MATPATVIGAIAALRVLPNRNKGGGERVNLQNPTDAEAKPSNTKDFDRISADAAQRDNAEDAIERAAARGRSRYRDALLDNLNPGSYY